MKPEPTKDPVLIAIRKERVQLERRLLVLNEAERKITGKPPESAFQLIAQRTARGEIRAAQLAKLRGAGWILSTDLKKLVLEARLLQRVNAQVWTNSLRALVGDGLVEKKENGKWSTYRLRRV